MQQANRYHPALFWLAFLTSVIAFVLIGSGGTVTSTGVGMVDVTWSLSFLNLFTVRGFEEVIKNLGLFIEHSHRLLGFIVGMLALSLALLGWFLERNSSPSFFSLTRRRQWIGIAVLIAVGLQARGCEHTLGPRLRHDSWLLRPGDVCLSRGLHVILLP
jgi:heme A synthase